MKLPEFENLTRKEIFSQNSRVDTLSRSFLVEARGI